MDDKNKAFQKRLREMFRTEAAEHLRILSSGLMELEKNPGREKQAALIESIFREAHSLKGAARSVDLYDIEAVCQPLENIFSALKREEMVVSASLFDLFHLAVNTIEKFIYTASEAWTPQDRSAMRVLIKQLHQATQAPALKINPEQPTPADSLPAGENASPMPSSDEGQPDLGRPAPGTRIHTETVRVPASRLDALLAQAQEMILVKLAANQRIVELKQINQTLEAWNTASEKWREQSIAPDAPYDETGFMLLRKHVSAVCHTAEQDLHALRRMVDEHVESMKQVMLLPITTLTEAFPKIVRDLARNQNKEVELIISGAEIEIDKRILEELKDPFIHLLRNCIDHSFKTPQERAGLNKPPKGTIHLAFTLKDGGRLQITVSDDGEGIDTSRVAKAAIKNGLLTSEAAQKLPEPDILPYIFKSGITTSPLITDISGRGLGLAIVREKVEKLGGNLSVQSRQGVGTTFSLTAPLTLATFRGLLVRSGNRLFILPILNVEHVKRIHSQDIKTIENHETLRLAGQVLPFVKLADMLALPEEDQSKTDKLFVVSVASGNARIALQVDEILDEQQVLVKGLGKQLRRVPNIAGATVLGTGKVVPILNVSDLIKSARRFAAGGTTVKKIKKEAAKTRRILVAEDSITSRALIKNILETAGFKVATAVDGLDAFTQVRSAAFDLVVSDVDMPQMSGFELTGKIRSDKKLADLPVVLVTALESRQDREHGIEVGANAYIVKSSFDQSNLLEVVRRLI